MDVTLTIRLIRSFEYRNLRNIVLHDVNLNISVEHFKDVINTAIRNHKHLPPPFKRFDYDTLKIEYKAHGAKTSDPIINTEDDSNLILKDTRSLKDNGVVRFSIFMSRVVKTISVSETEVTTQNALFELTTYPECASIQPHHAICSGCMPSTTVFYTSSEYKWYRRKKTFQTFLRKYFVTEHETEISFFKKEDYMKYKINKEIKW